MILKYLIPFERRVVRSRLPVAEAIAALQAQVEPARMFRFSIRDAKAFQGNIEGYGFRITRVIGYRNSFLPIIVGTFEPAPDGCVVRIQMRMHIAVMIFCAVWLSFLVPILIGFIMASVAGRPGFGLTVLMPVGMLVFFLGLTNGGFWVEANKQKKMLQDIFQGVAEERPL